MKHIPSSLVPWLIVFAAVHSPACGSSNSNSAIDTRAGIGTGGSGAPKSSGGTSGNTVLTGGGGSASIGGTKSTSPSSSTGGSMSVGGTGNSTSSSIGGSSSSTGGTNGVGGSTGVVRQLGINFFENTDWDFGYIFADVMKQARPWFVVDSYPDAVPLDANGWPTTDAEALFLLKDPGSYDASGLYKLTFQASSANVRVETRNEDPTNTVTVTNQAFSNGVVTADVTMSPSGNSLDLAFVNTTNGVRNVQLMRPGHTMGEAFAHDALSAISTFSLIRPMQMVGEPTNPAVNWSTRRVPTWPQQSNDETLGYGVSYEYLIMLANQAHKELWLCIPRLASEDYITKLAQLVRNGSDGTNPYTTTQANPKWPPLDSNVNVYLEFSNEVWNYSINEEHDLAVSEVNAGDVNHLNYDGVGNEWYWAFRRTGYKAMRISQIFRQVLGDAQMPGTGNSRIRPVLAGQFDYEARYTLPLQYVDAVWGPNNTYGNPGHPVNYYFYALSGAPYVVLSDSVSNSDSLTLDQLFADLNNSLSGTGAGNDGYSVSRYTDDLVATGNQYGLKTVAYEGGQSLWQNGHSNDVKAAAQNDPRMKQLTKDLLNKWYSVTDGPFVYFTIGRASDYFQLGNGYSDNNTQKWQALKEIAAGK